jgi:hypothetical protein
MSEIVVFFSRNFKGEPLREEAAVGAKAESEQLIKWGTVAERQIIYKEKPFPR